MLLIFGGTVNMNEPTEQDITIAKQYLLDRKQHKYGYDELLVIEGSTIYGEKWRYYKLKRTENNNVRWLKGFAFVRIDNYYKSPDQIEHIQKRLSRSLSKGRK